jgi:hypothetical protein
MVNWPDRYARAIASLRSKRCSKSASVCVKARRCAWGISSSDGFISLNHDGFVPPLENVSRPCMRAIEALGVNAIELAHSLCQIRFRCFDQQVVVIAHLAPCMASPVEALANLGKHPKPVFPVCV